MIMENMPPGFRFYPTEQELVTFYLREKLEDNRDDDLSRLMDRVIPVVNIYNYNPDQLPKFSEILCHKDTEQWFFFVPRQESEARGGRPNRLTATGFWKATGSPGYVYAWNRPVGEKKTMVFYVGKAPNGTKTEWKMNEYKAIDGEASSSNGANSNPVLRQELSLCRIYKKSKCLRAFDRRPLPDEEVFTMLRPPIPLAHQPPYYHHDQATASRDDHMIITRPPAGSDDDYQMAPSGILRITSSPESSASEDHHHHHHGHRGSSDQNMGIMNPSDSDFWDQLDCFCGMP